MEVLEAQIYFAGAPLLLNTTKDIFFRITVYLKQIMDLPGLSLFKQSISYKPRIDRIEWGLKSAVALIAAVHYVSELFFVITSLISVSRG